MEKTSDSNGKQKVRSAEVGTDILKALAELSPSTSLSRLAEHVQMPASKVHRYLQALIASGFAEQDPATNHYGLGREALRIGLAALNSMDVLKVAALPLAWLAFAVLLAQIALGGWTSANYAAAVCYQLPLCESGWSAQFSLRAAFSLPLGHESYEFGVLPYEARMSIHVLHRIGALVATGVVGSLALLCWRHALGARPRRLAVAVGVLLALQVTLGLINVVGQVPLGNAVAHNLTAACLLATLVLLIRQMHASAGRHLGVQRPTSPAHARP